MKPSKLTQGAAGASAWHPLDYHREPFQVSVGVDIGGGTLTYDLEYTYVNVRKGGIPAASEVYQKLTGQTAGADTQFDFPVAAVRLNVTAYTSGEAVARVLQAGVPGG